MYKNAVSIGIIWNHYKDNINILYTIKLFSIIVIITVLEKVLCVSFNILKYLLYKMGNVLK